MYCIALYHIGCVMVRKIFFCSEFTDIPDKLWNAKRFVFKANAINISIVLVWIQIQVSIFIRYSSFDILDIISLTHEHLFWVMYLLFALVCTEAAATGVLYKKVFLEISKKSQKNTSFKVSFLIKLQAFLRTPFSQNTSERLLLYVSVLSY